MMLNGFSVLFKFLEPMMFRSAGEFDPYVRGVHSRGVSMTMPSPSTVIGALATYCMRLKADQSPSRVPINNWDKAYLQVLGTDFRAKGPLLKTGDALFVEYHGKDVQGFIKIENLYERCRDVWKFLSSSSGSKGISPLKEDVDVKFDSVDRVGVMLETRADIRVKRVKGGFLYGVELVDFRSSGQQFVGNSEVIIDIFGKALVNPSEIKNVAVKLGGEGRVGVMSAVNRVFIFETLVKKLWNDTIKHRGPLALYVATPTLFKGGESIEKYVREWSSRRKFVFAGLAGLSMPLGAGYSLALNRRKPVYSALSPGSIIFLEKSEFDLSVLYVDSRLGEASEIGFGTLIPVPLS